MAFDYKKALVLAIDAAKEAGNLLRQEFYRKGGPRGNSQKAPADLEAEHIIRKKLLSFSDQYGFRGEEDPAANRAPKEPEQHFWLVDPNDGTAAFYEGIRGASVSIALIRGKLPVLGVIYSYASPDDNGDLFTWAEGLGPLQRNGKETVRQSLPKVLNESHIVLISHYADTRPLANALRTAPARYLKVPGIAYRLALLAAGEGEAAIGLSAPRDFDYAAGHALLRSVGGTILDENGKPVTYHRQKMRRVTHCFAGTEKVAASLIPRSWGTVLSAPKRTEESLDLLQPVPGEFCSDTAQLSRAQGCLLGQIAGDSLGSLVEFQNPAQIEKTYPKGPHELENGGTFQTLAGQPTDDSEMALLLARSLVAKQGFSLDAIANAYRFWFLSKPFDMGNTTYQALSAGADQEEKGLADILTKAASKESQSNGSLMRVSPLGIFGHAHSSQMLADFVRQDAALTHAHPISQDASVIHSVAIAYAISNGASARAVYLFAKKFASEVRLHPIIQEDLSRAHTEPPRDFLTHMGWVRIAFQNAFYQLLYAPTLEKALIDTVRRGGDTDTNAAICGALLGAVYGRDSIPTQWKKSILSCRPLEGLFGVKQPRPSPFWPVDCLQLAERLWFLGKKSIEKRDH